MVLDGNAPGIQFPGILGAEIIGMQVVRNDLWLNEVALSGGVWQNQILLDLVRDGLRRNEFMVYFHKQVPTNDGGLSLGQAVIANHIRAERSEPVGERSRSGF